WTAGSGKGFSFLSPDALHTGENCSSPSWANNCSRFAVRSAPPDISTSHAFARLIETRLQVNRVYQAQRSFSRQNRLFHLVHHVRDCDFIFRIGKGVTAARTGMSEGRSGWSEHLVRCIS